MKAMMLAALLLFAAAEPSQKYFHYQRPVELPPQTSAHQSCAVIDPQLYAHAAAGLSDVRLYYGSTETPYTIVNGNLSVESYPQNEPLNLGLREGKVSFDVKMPRGPYSEVWLNIDPGVQNFVLTVNVSGKDAPDSTTSTDLGSFTIFDLTQQGQGRSTSLHLPTSTFAYLQFSITGPLKPDAVKGLSYATSSEEPERIVVAETSQPKQQGRNTVYTLTVPKNVPVEEIRFIPSSNAKNFYRRVEVRSETPDKTSEEEPQDTVSGFDILRHHGAQSGKKIDEENLDFAVSARLDATSWTVTIHNGDDAPLALDSVRLEMFERKLCFDAAQDTSYSLYYGDAALGPAQYDYSNFFHLEKDAALAKLGSEQNNPQYEPRPDTRAFTEKHPALLWITLVAVVFILGIIALRSAKNLRTPQ